MKTFTKALTGTIAAGAMAIASASPAQAEHRDRDGISAGDIIAGALVIGGIAVIASAASKNNRDYRGYPDEYGYDRAGYGENYRDGYGRGYDRDSYWRGSPRRAVEQCVYAAERYASGRGMRADVTDIREVRDTRFGFQVKGRIAVNTRGRGWHRGDSDYGQGWGGDYRGWNHSMRGYDSGSFKCKFERGRVVDIDIDGIRGF
jgi:hypothetical protein